ncbi:toll/interleukin-1 receptor domain-containing protein [Odoribacter laneus]|uniref:toll/interleukin-1 receptor domain-containing protein n=1 Tax=Odoribacter laneus TaxID=626933 RepID=UPI0023F030B7|nr:toll/interleukin-1 receptor domain-containing protein [Odoribacter laneus]
MSIFTEDYLRKKALTKILDSSIQYFSKTSEMANFDIFLSHSFLDKEVVKGLYNTLTEQGFSVYVDWIVDPDLNRSFVTKESAEKIRKRMDQSRSLLYAISTNAEMSKWMPWELGYVDGHTRHKCAILPVTKTSESKFERMEYLKLYPIVNVSFKFTGSKPDISIQMFDYGTGQPLVNWIKY